MKGFTRWMVLGAVAGALALTGCQSKDRSQENMGGGTGGSGSTQGTQGTEPGMGAGHEQSTSPPPSQGEGSTMDQGMGGSGYDAGTGGSGYDSGTGGSGYDSGTGGSGMEEGTGTGMEGSGGSGSTTGGNTGSGTVPEPTR
ncbi:hypothetical protein [Corallococcus sp. AB011P]|uniref:hypothetical protein n=1 Tax=Corallococcus sp. AB011P TaxID=2316735 RepID=UPI0018F78059|nr:hypothetical protein [Corallococcus sp. AB011P]